MVRRALASLALTLALASCSGDDSSSSNPYAFNPGAGGAAASCVPNQVISCPCPSSSLTGVQTCQADGKTFSACLGCGASPAGGAGGAGGVGGMGVGGGKQTGGSGGIPGGPGGSGGIPGGPGGSGGSGGEGPGGSGGQGPGGSGGQGPGGSGGGSPTCQAGDPNVDGDSDGWTPAQGDCNDCDPLVNPGAYDFVEVDALGLPLPDAAQIDNDCSGAVALTAASCDAGLPIEMATPFDAARAMGLCSVEVPEAPADPAQRRWGVVVATLSDIAGPFLSSPIKVTQPGLGLSFGLLPSFGVSPPQEGSSLFALSSGLARAKDQPGFDAAKVCSFDKGVANSYPPGFPKTGSCGNTGDPHDGVALDLEIRVPTNARSFTFDYRFFSCEYPQYVCEVYNDVFAVLMSPSPLMAGDAMADPTNMSADVTFQTNQNGSKEVVGVNNQDFFTACSPGPSGYVNCKGEAQLAGTGFEGHGGTSWVRAHVPVVPGSIIKLRVAIWDSADGILDSTALVDRFVWSPNPVPQVYSEVLDGGLGGSGGASGSGGSSGNQGGSGGASAGSGGSGGQPFGGFSGFSGASGSGPFGGSSGSGGGTGTAGAPGVGPCSDGTCSAAGQCCKGLGQPCGTVFGSICF